MVRGLTVGILHSDVQDVVVETTIDKLPRKGEKPHVIVDGISLAYHLLTPENKEHSWEFINGGNYKLYTNKLIQFIALLKSYNVDITIVFPLSDGTPPITEQNTSRWNQKAMEKVRRVARAKNMMDKGSNTSRTLQEVLPPLIVNEIVDTARTENVEVIFTRNNIVRFASIYVASGKADAVVGQNSDYLIFENVNYIPLDSIGTDADKALTFELLNNKITAQLIKLEHPEKLFQLSVLLGNPFTESFVASKYNISSVLHIKLNPKYPDSLVVGLVGTLNNPDFDSIETTSPIREIIEGDEEFKKAIEDSRAFFDVNVPLDPEGESEVVKHTLQGTLPLWATAIFENGDFWYEPIVDDYDHAVKTDIITQPLRKFFYSILDREKVIEHIPKVDSVETIEVNAEGGFPNYKKLWAMKGKKEKNLVQTYRGIPTCLFPPEYKPPKDDPLEKLGEPFITIGLALRYLISICFTDNQGSFSLLPEDGPENLKKAFVKGAPPIDLFELKSLAAAAIIMNLGWLNRFNAPSAKPKLRRVKVAAYYQTIVQHLFWLQQLMGIKIETARITPHRLYDGEIFAALYECGGEITSPDFIKYFLVSTDDEKADIEKNDKTIKDLEKLAKERFVPFLNVILSEFPPNIFDAFAGVPRSISKVAYDEAKPVQTEVIVAKSAFAGLLDSDDEEDGEAPPPPPPVAAAPPPPPPKKQPKKKGKEDDDEDEDMEAFLLAQAAKKQKEAAAEEKTKAAAAAAAAPKGQKKKPHVRRLEGGLNANNPSFNKESKQEFKRQLKQQGFDYN